MKIKQGTPLVVSLRWAEDHIMPVGRLATRDRRIYFQYDTAFTRATLPISPFNLPPGEQLFGPFTTPFEGLPGVFNDSLPDGWGRLLMDRRARRLGVSLTPLDRLAVVGERGIGALVYAPAIELEESRGPLDLDALAADTVAVLDGAADDVVDRLIVLGGSPQGARPKAMVAWSERDGRVVHGVDDPGPDFRHFLVKFKARSDPADIGPIEFAYSLMARAAGLRVPDSRLFSGRRGSAYFGSERFDRAGAARHHVHTLSGLLHADHRTPGLDYVTVLAAAQRLTRNHGELLAMFRHMVFNVAAHNRDDHAKQFSFRMDRTGAWTVAPAYDLTFSDGINGEHTTTVDGEGAAPGTADLLRVADKFGIKKSAAQEAIDAVRTAVRRWPRFADDAGVTKDSRSDIDRILNPNRRRR